MIDHNWLIACVLASIPVILFGGLIWTNRPGQEGA